MRAKVSADARAVGRRRSKPRVSKLERRQRIIEIAKRSFVDKGYAATTMSACAAELGGSKSTLWKQFASKEELFSAVIDDASKSFRVQLSDMISNEGSVRKTVLGFCGSFIERIISPDGLWLHRLVVAEAVRFPEVVKIFSSRVLDPVQTLLADYFEVQMSQHVIVEGDSRRIADVLLSLCRGSLFNHMIEGGVTGDKRKIDEESLFITEVFLRAFVVSSGK